MDRQSQIVAGSGRYRVAGMQPHAHAEAGTRWPIVARQYELRRKTGGDGVADDRPVLFQQRYEAVPEPAEQARGAFDVGENEGYEAGGGLHTA